MTSAVEKLDQVIALIDTPEKWCKGFLSSGSQLCMLGAMYHAGYRLEAEWFEVEEAIYRSLPMGLQSIILFNDTFATTHADVMRVLRRAREILKEQER